MFSKNFVLRTVKWLGYPMAILFSVSFISAFFQKIEPIGILGSLFLAVMSVGMLYSRGYAFHGSKFWYYYMLGSLITIMLFSFGLLFWGTIATAIFFPIIFYSSFFPIIGLIKAQPSSGGSSPYKTLTLFATFIPLSAVIIIAWAQALLGKY